MSAYYVAMDTYFFVHFTRTLSDIGNGLSPGAKTKIQFQTIIFFMAVIACLISFFKIFNAAFGGIFENIDVWCLIDATAILFMNDFILNASELLKEQRNLIDIDFGNPSGQGLINSNTHAQ